MAEIIGLISFVIILIIVITFIFFYSASFIKPTTVQIQLFGIHLTIYGGFVLLNNLLTGFLSMLVGLAIGVYGSFKGYDLYKKSEE
ncbi:hypothetical protein [Pontibacillus sp. HMF3514]|uniref:hypothetical protein n=1 Tax=Pontibacillus sp. HMF3514 TaxID=2692425 RepID=UPI00132036AD|nr:hypothetical protein [Pontibacillus sp. HMF3514]QHE52770.1 hypothetical protein GS400_12355 [Pontibacillus sp. HMF3514]